MNLPVPRYTVVGDGLRALVDSENLVRLVHGRLFYLCVLLLIIESPQEDEFQEYRPCLLEQCLAQSMHNINACEHSGGAHICICSEISVWGHESPTWADDFGKPLLAPQTGLVLSH